MSDDLKIFGKNHLGIDGFRVQSIDGTWLTYRRGGKDLRPVADENDVILIDMDGEILYSYSKAEFAQLTELPTIPTLKYSFLTQDGWNWTLSDAKAYVAKYGELVIGAQYTTTDNKTIVYIEVPPSGFFGLTVAIRNAGASSGNTITVDWGDGTTPSTETGLGRNVSKSFTHTYSTMGKYIIKASCTNPNIYISAVWPRGYCIAITNNCPSQIGTYASGIHDMIHCTGATGTIGNMAASSRFLKAMVFPRGFATAYENSNWFQSCPTIKYVSWPKGAIGALYGYNYKDCPALCRVSVPEEVTEIKNSTLYQCYSIVRLTIPENVTTIAAQAFYYTSQLQELHFRPTTPPTVANANAFTNMNTACKIYVPTGYLTDYTTASNYPDPNTYTYIEE